MATEEQSSDSVSDRAVECGETYHHADHGRVEVTGIWRRTQHLDAVSDTGGNEMIVVRYVPAEDGRWIDELAESLADFVEATG